MNELQKLTERIIQRVNINLREPTFDATPFIRTAIPPRQLTKFYAFYAITPHHPLHFHFSHSSLAGSYFLGKCIVEHSILYKCDIRGDELKRRGDCYNYQGLGIPLHDDEIIRIRDSYLVKTLVHNYSRDPENLEEFTIQNTASMHHANIHGAPVEGCFLGPFSTVDLTTLHDCVVGAFAYVQAGELSHVLIDPGTVWIRKDNLFDFKYRFSPEVLQHYINCDQSRPPRGVFMDFVEHRKKDFEEIFAVVNFRAPIPVPTGATLSQYTVVKGSVELCENVLVAQRAYLEDATLGKGSNAQENCYIIRAHLQGNNVTAHGGKVIHAVLEENVFVGFNSFLQGKPYQPLSIGKGSIVMPHTIIDAQESLRIPPRHLVWGYISNNHDLKDHTMPLEAFSQIDGEYQRGAMRFAGNGGKFTEAFERRIEHILEANGAYFDGTRNRGHAQKNHIVSYNTIQPYPKGSLQGIYPTIEIRP